MLKVIVQYFGSFSHKFMTVVCLVAIAWTGTACTRLAFILVWSLTLCFFNKYIILHAFNAVCWILSRGPFGQLRKNIKALGGPKYNARGLEALLSQYFDDNDETCLNEMLTSVIIPSFDIKLQQPVFFSSWKVSPLALLVLVIFATRLMLGIFAVEFSYHF